MAGRDDWGSFRSLADVLGRGGPASPLLDPRVAPGATLANALRLDETDPYHLEVAELDGVIDQAGHPCELRRAVTCPCQRGDTVLPGTGCEDCRGLGWVYPETLREGPIRILVSGRNESAQPEPAGSHSEGRVSLTFPSRITPGFGDLVLPENTVHLVHETRVHAARAVNPYTLPSSLESTLFQPPEVRPAEDRLLYPDIEAIEALLWKNDQGDLVLGREGLDYELQQDRIRWRPGRGPRAGTSYSVRYRAPAAYIVQGEVAPRTEGGSRLPYRCSGLKLERLGRPDVR